MNQASSNAYSYAPAQREFEWFCDDMKAIWRTQVKGVNIAIVPLLFHVALYVNPEVAADAVSIDFDERFCYRCVEDALIAISQYEEHGRWRLYQKDWVRNVTIVNGYGYKPGVPPMPEFASYQVDWAGLEQ